MAKEVGRSVPLSPFRRLVTDLMSFSQRVPAVTIERRVNLRPLVAARELCSPRPGWAVLFAKALALVAKNHPELRRSYMAFPRGRLYEHPHSVVALNVERHVAGEAIVTQCLIRGPENRSLVEMDALVRHCQVEPVERLRAYQRAVAMGKIPWPLRRWFWWAALNASGRRRCHNFGTFGLSSVAAQGAGILHLIPVLTSMLHYGLFDAAGSLELRLTWDHRVMDGAAAARILVEVEQTLKGEVLAELSGMRLANAA